MALMSALPICDPWIPVKMVDLDAEGLVNCR